MLAYSKIFSQFCRNSWTRQREIAFVPFPAPKQQKRFRTSGRIKAFIKIPSSYFSTASRSLQEKNNRVLIILLSVVIGGVGITYASVPLYKVFCQATGFGGTTQRAEESDLENLRPVDGARPIKVHFSSVVSSSMPWTFRPQQHEVSVIPGETALAFYTAKNHSDKAITGVATYNVYPPKAGLYFNKIQCFCFEEQRLKANEEIDMPVFFFIDPEILDDPTMVNVHNITLSYTFFKTDEDDAAIQAAVSNK